MPTTKKMLRGRAVPTLLMSALFSSAAVALPAAAYSGPGHAGTGGIVNGSFESYEGRNGWTITSIDGWRGVNAQTVTPETASQVNFEELPLSQGIEVWRNFGPSIYFGQNKVELDGHRNIVDGIYQRFTADAGQYLSFVAYARQGRTSDVEVYIDGEYVETVRPPKHRAARPTQAYYYPITTPGEHTLLLKEVARQDNGKGALIDHVRLVSPMQKSLEDSAGRTTHDFVEHVQATFGDEILAPGQQRYAGYQWVSPTRIEARSPITGLRPVIEQAIDQVRRRNPNLSGERLESAIAKRLTELNDFNQLTRQTQDRIIEITGIDFRAMSRQQQEMTINHLQHSPVPFGDVTEVLTPNVTIALGFTHTLDKRWTRVSDLGNGLFKIWLISNNNNGSHTGHTEGSFLVQMMPGTTVNEARQIANGMIENRNNNNRLALDEAAKAILYGQTPRLD